MLDSSNSIGGTSTFARVVHNWFGKPKRAQYSLVRSVRVDALAVVLARILQTLVDVVCTVHAAEAFRADALDVPIR